MMKFASALIALIGLSVPVQSWAAIDDDGFGSAFTSRAPAALGDVQSGSALSSASDLNANDVSKIEPAAGDSVFTLPEDPAAANNQSQKNETLSAPDKPVVPGMDSPKP